MHKMIVSLMCPVLAVPSHEQTHRCTSGHTGDGQQRHAIVGLIRIPALVPVGARTMILLIEVVDAERVAHTSAPRAEIDAMMIANAKSVLQRVFDDE